MNNYQSRWAMLAMFLCILAPVSDVQAQIQPTNAKEYFVHIFFLQAFGTIGSDGSGNPPDPSWQMRFANNTEGDIRSLLVNTPNYDNQAFTYALTTSNNDWHPIQDAEVGFIEGNRNGLINYEVMSYENDCVAQSIYNVGGGCADDDDNMLYKEGLLDIQPTYRVGSFDTTEINIDPINSISKVRFRHVYRHVHGQINSPLTFGTLRPGVGYYHRNHAGAIDSRVFEYFPRDWTLKHPNFSTRTQVTYSFELTDSREVDITLTNSDGVGQLHLVSLYGGNFQSYIGRVVGEGTFSPTLSAGEYALVADATGSGEIEEFAISLLAKCNANTIEVDMATASNQYEETNGTIVASAQIQGGSTVFDAGTEVLLNPGFEVLHNAQLEVLMEGCGAQDIDGHHYPSVQIGGQTWMAANLKTSRYNDGSPLEAIELDSEWANSQIGAYSWYENDSTMYEQTFGKLYNWFALDSLSTQGRNVCPIGWRIPEDHDWHILFDYLDNHNFLDPNGGGSSIAGYRLKEAGIDSWLSNTGTNAAGWAGRGGGVRQSNGSFAQLEERGYWWSKTESNADRAWLRYLIHNSTAGIRSSFLTKNAGLSVRCIRSEQ